MLCNVIFVKNSSDEYRSTTASSLNCTVYNGGHYCIVVVGEVENCFVM